MPEASQITPRPIDGQGSNSQHEDWGAAGTELVRLAPSDLGPNGEMSGGDRPNPRQISNEVSQQTGDMPNAAGASDFLWIWGQFLDHDLSLTEAGTTISANIQVPVGDAFFDPMGMGGAVIPFTRVDQHDGAYVNQITSFIDASMIYGSDLETAEKMVIEGGKLLMTEDAQLMLEGANLVTGDTRAAENIALSSMHTIFTREHNRIVDEYTLHDPTLTDDQLFNLARAQVEGIVQAITFNEFLPILVGDDAFAAYGGFDSNVDPGISAEFSTAVYRLGHTLLSSSLQRVSEGGEVLSPLALRDAFFRPSLLSQDGLIEDILRGAATQSAQALDTFVVEDVRSFLFGPPGAGGLDLASLNIQRGRDLGVASYNDLREAVGLERAMSFDDVTSDGVLATKLATLYGTPDDMDAWIGGLAEDAVGDGLLGELFSVVLIDQFTRLRDGDPFWSEEREGLGDDLRDALWDTTLSDVILRTTDVDAMQKNVFLAMARTMGTSMDETLAGTSDADFVFADAGHDLLLGRKGNDDLQGGSGQDTLRGHRGDDCLDGGDGRDVLQGGLGDDTLIGGALDDTLNGGDGEDVLEGEDGDDKLKGKNGNDILIGGGGDDTLKGHSGDDVLWGESGSDILNGGAGNDILLGGEGDDVLVDGQGNDVLFGGGGQDRFVFKVFENGTNTISDFEIGIDVLEYDNPFEWTLVEQQVGLDLHVSFDVSWSVIVEDYFL